MGPANQFVVAELPTTELVPAGFVPTETLHRFALFSNAAGTLSMGLTGGKYDLGLSDDVELRPNSMFDAANDQIVIQQGGLYKVTFSGPDNTNASTADIQLHVDGTQVAQVNNDQGDAPPGTLQWIGDLTAGQVLSLHGDQVIYSPSLVVEQLPTHTVVTAETRQYSTTEQQTDRTWIDGKPIYERGYAFASLANGSSTVDTISGIDAIIEMNLNFLLIGDEWTNESDTPGNTLASGSIV